MTTKNRIFPPWNEINNFKQPLTLGERFLAEYLDRNLPEDWKVYLRAELDWGGDGSTPDIVIAHKSNGIMIIEVKDIDLKKYSRKTFKNELGQEKDRFCRNEYVAKKNKKIPIPVTDPIDQISEYKNLLIQNIPEIADDIFDNLEKKNLIQCGLYFHHEDFKLNEAKKLIGDFDPREIHLFDRKELLKGKDNIRNVVPLLKENKNITMGEEWFDKFSNWIMPPLHRIEQGIKLSFNQKQKRYTYPKPQAKQKLAGVAGSGKTLVLAYRAAKLAEQNKKVLIICFNITLKHYIKKQIKKAAVKFSWRNIRINHFHGFTKNYSFKFPSDLAYPFKGTQNENLEQHVKNVIAHRKINKDYFKYDAILIDEGQDFKEDWYKFLCDFLTENEEVIFAVDEKQNIYNRDLSWVGKGRWGILNQGYRIPREQIKIINNFSRKFLKLFDDNDENPEILPPDDNQLSLLPMSPKSIWKNIKSFDEVKNSVDRSLVYLLNELSMKKSDIVILVDSHKEGKELKNHIIEKFKFDNIMDIFNIADRFLGRLKKYRFRIDSPYLKMSTIHSFKGWEARNVIIVTPEKKSIDSQLYAALTRVRENLIVFNRNERYAKFGHENFEALN